MTTSASPRGSGNEARSRVLRSSRGLHIQLASSLRERLNLGEWVPGDKLPTETQLAREYQVSRSTVRGALQLLETQGRTTTRHGLGTFVVEYTREIAAGLQELRSMSETILAHGLEPSMEFHSAAFRPATESEARDLRLPQQEIVLATERAVLASGEVVAYSYDAIPRSLLADDLDPDTLSGSLFALLHQHGHDPTSAVSEIHATTGAGIGWGDRPRAAAYLLLDQVHYTSSGQAVLASKTYFLEGRFQFSVLRVR